jgi:hypothetical protein
MFVAYTFKRMHSRLEIEGVYIQNLKGRNDADGRITIDVRCKQRKPTRDDKLQGGVRLWLSMVPRSQSQSAVFSKSLHSSAKHLTTEDNTKNDKRDVG